MSDATGAPERDPDGLDALAHAVGQWLAARGAHAGSVLAIARLELRLFWRLLLLSVALAILALLLAAVIIAGSALLAVAALTSLWGNVWLAAAAVLAALLLALAFTVRMLGRYAQHMGFAVTREALGMGAAGASAPGPAGPEPAPAANP